MGQHGAYLPLDEHRYEIANPGIIESGMYHSHRPLDIRDRDFRMGFGDPLDQLVNLRCFVVS